jgi:heme-degrading monooxygenase HmoA
MHARVTTFPGLAPERIKATVEEFKEQHLPQLELAEGYRGCWVGVDFTGGRAIAVTFWDTMDAIHATDQLASQARAAAVTRAGVDRERPTVIDRYEIVVNNQVVGN